MELRFASVSSGWSAYFQGLLAGFDIHLPLALTAAFDSTKGTIIDLPAVCIIMLITLLLSLGAKETVRFNLIMVCVKVGVVLLFIAIGIFYVKPDNWTPFLPYGFSGVLSAAAIVFLLIWVSMPSQLQPKRCAIRSGICPSALSLLLRSARYCTLPFQLC